MADFPMIGSETVLRSVLGLDSLDDIGPGLGVPKDVLPGLEVPEGVELGKGVSSTTDTSIPDGVAVSQHRNKEFLDTGGVSFTKLSADNGSDLALRSLGIFLMAGGSGLSGVASTRAVGGPGTFLLRLRTSRTLLVST